MVPFLFVTDHAVKTGHNIIWYSFSSKNLKALWSGRERESGKKRDPGDEVGAHTVLWEVSTMTGEGDQ